MTLESGTESQQRYFWDRDQGAPPPSG